MSVKLRKKKVSGGKISLYLDEELSGGYLECLWLDEELSGGYGVMYLTTSLPKVFPSLSFAVPSRETL